MPRAVLETGLGFGGGFFFPKRVEEEGGERKLSRPQHKELSQEAKEKAGA